MGLFNIKKSKQKDHDEFEASDEWLMGLAQNDDDDPFAGGPNASIPREIEPLMPEERRFDPTQHSEEVAAPAENDSAGLTGWNFPDLAQTVSSDHPEASASAAVDPPALFDDHWSTDTAYEPFSDDNIVEDAIMEPETFEPFKSFDSSDAPIFGGRGTDADHQPTTSGFLTTQLLSDDHDEVEDAVLEDHPFEDHVLENHPLEDNPFGGSILDDNPLNHSPLDHSPLDHSPLNNSAQPSAAFAERDAADPGPAFSVPVDAFDETESDNATALAAPSALFSVPLLSEPAPERGPESDMLCEILGAEPGAAWPELRAAHAAAMSEYDPRLESDADRVALAKAIRREMNLTYAALRLLAAA